MTATSQITRPAFKTEQRLEGIFSRVRWEVSAAAAARDLEALAYWHARQRSAEAIYYRNGLYKQRPRKGDEPRFDGPVGAYRCPSEAWLNCEP